jgi:antitoxin CptB
MSGRGLASVAKLKWRCRRGMRELDVVLLRYLEEDYPQATESDRRAFAQLLELQDPDIFRYLVGQDPESAGALRNVINSIRRTRA